jgi:hypothetical protein
LGVRLDVHVEAPDAGADALLRLDVRFAERIELLPQKLAEARAKIEVRAKERFEQEQAAHQAKLAAREAKTATGKKPGGKPPEPPAEGPRPTDQINLTDEESRIMPVSGGGFDQCYNAQAVVAAGSLLVIASTVVQAPNDKQQAEPMLAKIAALPEGLGKAERLLGDNGYFVATIGLDIAKTVFQVHGVDASGQIVIRRRSIRGRVLAFFEKLKPCLVGIEACSSSHYWARELSCLAAWIGLGPKQNSSGGKDRLGSISKAGNRYLRQMLVVGAMAVIRYAERHGTRRPWLIQFMQRRSKKVAAVALANKTARIIWALMTNGERYREPSVAGALAA